MARLSRLLAIVVLLLMPLGMANSPAVAQPAPQSAAAEDHEDHHGDHRQRPEAPSQPPQLHCAACVALPALVATGAAGPLPRNPPVHVALVDTFFGIDPETETPPPKSA